MDRVQTVIKAQQATATVLAHVARAKELLAGADCRKLAEEDLLLSSFDLQATLRAARKELMAAVLLIHKTPWPKGGALDAYVRWSADQRVLDANDGDETVRLSGEDG